MVPQVSKLCSIFSGKENHYDTVGGGQAEEHQQEPHQEQDGRPRLLFHCQLAQVSSHWSRPGRNAHL